VSRATALSRTPPRIRLTCGARSQGPFVVRIYCDSSALIRRVLPEPESGALVDLLRSSAGGDVLVSSILVSVEVSRAIRLACEADDPREVAIWIEDALAGVATSPVTDQVIDLARRYGPTSVRTLDVLHLATATLVGADVVLSYDRLMLRAASE